MKYPTNYTLTSKLFIQSLTKIHFALVLGQLLFMGVSIFLSHEDLFFAIDKDDIFILIVPIISLISIIIGVVIFNKRNKKNSQIISLKEKCINYQTTAIIKFALVEAPLMLSTVILLLTANWLYLFISIALTIYFISLRPTLSNISKNIMLNGNEEMTLKNPEAELQ